MSLRIGGLGSMFRPRFEEGSFRAYRIGPAYSERKVDDSPPTDFSKLFSAIIQSDTRSKPSYTDCWVLAPSEDLNIISEYRTEYCGVTVGMAPDGEMEYDVMPLEYSYPDALNAIVLEVIEEIRMRHRETGGRLDRDTVWGYARSALALRMDEIKENSKEGTDHERLIDDMCSIVHRYSVGAGIFEILLTDQHIEDVYVDAPCNRNRIHVTMNGIDGVNSHMRCRTNLIVDRREVMNLINILKRTSGLRFCQADPVLETDFPDFDARATVIGYPMSPRGEAVAIRKHSIRPWTLSRLIANNTLDPRMAGTLSFLVNNRSTFLICGPRGAGKSSLLSALMFELGKEQRILTIEDTIELPGEQMRSMGYKVQSILVDDRISGDQLSRSDEALRVSLRMGESAIILGEVRGTEAKTLYQSMRAGRAGSSIMGTIHGDSAESTYRRVIDDMGVSPEAFMATDVIVTLGTIKDRRTGNLIRKTRELVCTGEKPGEFVDASNIESLLNTPVMKRAMLSAQMNRSDVMKEIRARSIMRDLLARAGRENEMYLGPEWILLANEMVSHMSPGETADSIVRDFNERMKSGRP